MVFASYIPLLAQDTEESNTLFGNLELNEVRPMAWVGAGILPMAGKEAVLFSARVGPTIKDRIGLGGFVRLSTNDVRPMPEMGNAYLDYRAYGGYIEYTLFHDRMLHLAFPILIGGGEIEMDSDEGELEFGEANFLVIEPSVLAELRLTENFTLSGGIGYHWASAFDYLSFNENDLTGITGKLGLRFTLSN